MYGITDDLYKQRDLHGERKATASEDPGDQGGRDHGEVLSDLLHAALVHLGLGNPLGLGSSVLEPNLDLERS